MPWRRDAAWTATFSISHSPTTRRAQRNPRNWGVFSASQDSATRTHASVRLALDATPIVVGAPVGGRRQGLLEAEDRGQIVEIGDANGYGMSARGLLRIRLRRSAPFSYLTPGLREDFRVGAANVVGLKLFRADRLAALNVLPAETGDAFAAGVWDLFG